MGTRVIYHAQNSTEANVLQGWLKEAGIDAHIFNEEPGVFDLGMETAPQITVDETDYEKAATIVQLYEEQLKKETDMSVVSDAEGQFDWPICPQCDELRYATCGNCQTIGSEFAANDADDGPRTICLACSQPTEIEFVDLCKFCGHNFAMHTEDQHDLAAGSEHVNNSRVIVVIAVLVVLFIAVVFFLLISAS